MMMNLDNPFIKLLYLNCLPDKERIEYFLLLKYQYKVKGSKERLHNLLFKGYSIFIKLPTRTYPW